MDTRLMQKFLMDFQKNRQKLEKQLQDIQNTEFVSLSGGGLCEVVMNGKYELVRCKLDDKVLGDKETIEDLIVTSVTEVVKKINSEIKKIEQELLPKGMF